MSTRWSARAGFMGSLIYLPDPTYAAHNMRCALHVSFLPAGASMAAIAMRLSWAAADKEKMMISVNKSSRTTRTIRLDKRSRYYPGLWIKHGGKCLGILKIELSYFFRERDWGFQLNPERNLPATASLDTSGEESDEYEYLIHHEL
ncbi:hypothetical protein EDD22DRAFT_862106 [Suillus occidentalis]|nr:hypothetical protein EDD22DRAFT_862106 [Suillus occidentalis]